MYFSQSTRKNGKETVVTVFFPFFTIISFSNFTQLLVFYTYKAGIYIRFATCQWEFLTPTDISIPLTHRLVLYALEAGECLFCGKADIRNPLLLLAHERSRFATCQWELLTPTDISIPLTHRLVLYALEAGECLFCVQKIYNSTICFVKKYFAAPTADASFLYEHFFKYETSCSKPLYAITFSPSGII